ncbi:MAG: cytidine deaminase [Clostridiales bacterium]|nr:cytidine deaminase [Clostridiales bacterium]
MKIEWTFHAPIEVEKISGGLLQLAADATQIVEEIHLPCAVSIHFVTQAEIKELNTQHRGIEKATDVLSFPLVNYPAGNTAKTSYKQIKNVYDDTYHASMLGDLFFSMDHIKAQAKTYGHSFERELTYLFVHGIFHLFGYDHIDVAQQKEMRKMEEKTLHMIGQGKSQNKVITDEELLQFARQAMERSYSPYSRYPVGACILCEDGRIFQGCNIENASFGLSNCAERTAVFKAVSEGARDFVSIAIAAKNSPPWPCGACRQVLNEFAPDIRVLVTWDEGNVESATLQELLPHGFGPKDLPDY